MIFAKSETNLPRKKRKKNMNFDSSHVFWSISLPLKEVFLTRFSLCPITETATYLRLVRVIIQLCLTTTMVFNDSSNKEQEKALQYT